MCLAVVGFGYAIPDGVVAVAEQRPVSERHLHQVQDIAAHMDLRIVEPGQARALHRRSETGGPTGGIAHGGLHGPSLGERSEEERRIQTPLLPPAHHGEADPVGHARKGCS